jgi:hypothetical protein
MHNGDTVIELKEAAVIKHNIIAIAKMRQPQTLQTPEVPYIQFTLRGSLQPLLIPYDTDEECNEEYEKVLAALKSA